MHTVYFRSSNITSKKLQKRVGIKTRRFKKLIAKRLQRICTWVKPYRINQYFSYIGSYIGWRVHQIYHQFTCHIFIWIASKKPRISLIDCWWSFSMASEHSSAVRKIPIVELSSSQQSHCLSNPTVCSMSLLRNGGRTHAVPTVVMIFKMLEKQ